MGQQLFLSAKDIKINENDIQGDVLVGLQKKAEIFAFFQISNPALFKAALHTLIPDIATTKQARLYEEHHGNDVVKTNIAFTAAGLNKLGASDVHKADPSFVAGIKNSAASLGDDVQHDWLPSYIDHAFHGLLLIAAWNLNATPAGSLAKARLAAIIGTFGG